MRRRQPAADRPRWHAVVTAVSCALLAIGVVVGIWFAAAPEQVERVVGEAKVNVEKATVAVQKQAGKAVGADVHPTVRLGPLGHRSELNWCDGRFIQMREYQIRDVLPVYAAHNDCGGDIILRWEVGDIVRISGRDELYEVVDERHTPKWAEVKSLRGMTGELLLQTCFYGQDKMRFLALQPVQT